MWIHTPPGGTRGVTSYHYDAVGNRINVVYSSSGSTPPFPQMVYEVDGLVNIAGDTTGVVFSNEYNKTGGDP